MRLINLINYTESNSDEFILNALKQSSDSELLKYVSNVTADLLNSVFLTDEFKINARKNFNEYNDVEIGELSTYMSITPYVQVT